MTNPTVDFISFATVPKNNYVLRTDFERQFQALFCLRQLFDGLSSRRPEFDTWQNNMEFVVNKVVLENVYFLIICSAVIIVKTSVLYNYLLLVS
jgi:hypothetical protein